MSLTICTDKSTIAKVQRLFADAFKASSTEIRRAIATRAGSSLATYHWRPDLQLWGVFKKEVNRYWNAFGTCDPNVPRSVDIVCEINSPYEGVDRRIAAFFAEDSNGRFFLAHTGKIGGGRKNVGKQSFWAHFRGAPPVTATYPDGRQLDVIVIGMVGDKRLPAQLAHFVREVGRIKSVVTSGQPTPPTDDGPVAKYTPEFLGDRTPYPLGGIVESSSYHGLVVNALVRALDARGLACGNDRARDLYVTNRGGHTICLFEVKTDLSTSAVYGAIGQLMYHGFQDSKSPRLVVVLPGTPSERTQAALKRIAIDLVSYELEGDDVRFSGLSGLLADL